MVDNNSPPRYETYCFIYLEDKMVGKTRTYQEAEKFCKLNPDYQWDLNTCIKDKKKRIELYRDLPLFTLNMNLFSYKK